MVAGALAAGWIGASSTQGPAPAQSLRASRTVAGPIGSTPTLPRAESLRKRVSAPAPPSGGRNPFIYGSRAPIRSTGFRDRPATPSELPETAYTPPPPPLPVFKLSGIASNAEGGGTVLTAIVNDNGGLVLVKAGDKLSNGYSVVRVDETSVTLVDAAGVTQTVRLP